MAPSNALKDFTADNDSIAAFNFFVMTDYNQWYTMTSGDSTTVLVSKFVYKITSIDNATVREQIASDLEGLILDSTTADKLCYASITTGNVIFLRFSSRHN